MSSLIAEVLAKARQRIKLFREGQPLLPIFATWRRQASLAAAPLTKRPAEVPEELWIGFTPPKKK